MARLLEEVSPENEDEVAPVKPEGTGVPFAEVKEAAIPQADKPSSWQSPVFGLSQEPLFQEFMRLDFSPADYGPDQPQLSASVVCEPPPETDPVSLPKEEPAGVWKQVPVIITPSEVESIPAPKPAAAAAVEAAAPTEIDFQLGTYSPELPEEEKPKSSLLKYAAIGAAAAALAVASYFGVYFTLEEPKSEVVITAPDDWIPSWSSGYRGDEIVLFGPSREWSDYLVEAQSGSNQEIAWIYRAQDANNYYVVKLGAGGRGLLRLLRYSIVRGQMSDRTEIAVARPTPAGNSYGVQLEVRGSEFTLYLEDEPVAGWSDDHLNKGGFGVISTNTDLAGLADVKVIQLGSSSAIMPRPLGAGSASPTLAAITITRTDRERGGDTAALNQKEPN